MTTHLTISQYRALKKKPRAGGFRDRHMAALIAALKSDGHDVQTEYRFHDKRKWRFDVAIPALKIAIEYEGVYGGGKTRHTSTNGYTSDCDKYNEAVIAGWRVLRFTAKNVRKAIETVRRACNG